MTSKTKRRLLATAASLMALAAAGPSLAQQDYPNKPVKIIVGYVPGGGPDMVARALGQKLAEILGQPFVVENRPGAGGALSNNAVVKSAPDGYTLLMGETGQLVVLPYLNKNSTFNPLKEFAPVAMVSSEPLLVVTNPKSQVNTLSELVRNAKESPGKIPYGSSGLGTIHHITGEMLQAETGISLMHVPFKGSGQSVPAALAGDVPLLITSFAGAGAHIRAGTLKLLAVTSPNRIPSSPNVPSVAEFAKVDFDFQSEMGVLAPIGTPPAVISKLSAAIKQATESPDFIVRFKDTATVMTYKTPAEYAENLRRNLVKYEKAAKVAKLQGE